ncbi:hypothetical protein SNEBB_006712 [Seison nebaliae]|nr:hypothetical protein SNEBB_006712 [Seison nebaliae]
MTTNVWLKQKWLDRKLRWNPSEHAGIEVLNIPSTKIWLPDIRWIDYRLTWDLSEFHQEYIEIPIKCLWRPDIVLFNNAEGTYEVTLMTMATVHYSGEVIWEPPAIYRSSCPINVEYFPFDTQICSMKFGSWTYNGNEVDLLHMNSTDDNMKIGIDLIDFYRSVEWDIMAVPAYKNAKQYPCCVEFYPDITYKIVLRRKTLFYTVNLIIPCVGISLLTILTFYLPSDSGEKVSLCISILLSLTVFFLLLAELIPPTSLVVPLIGKYLSFTMILVTLSVVITVFILNIRHRTSATHSMPQWMRTVFFNIMPRMLFLHPPIMTDDDQEAIDDRSNNSSFRSKDCFSTPAKTIEETTRCLDIIINSFSSSQNKRNKYKSSKRRKSRKNSHLIHPSIIEAFYNTKFIAKQIHRENDNKKICEEWKYVALVLDRLFLWIFLIACAVGMFGIIFQAPSLYDSTKPIDEIYSNRF